MGFGAEMKDFLDAADRMSDVRYRNAARRKIEWEMQEPDGGGPSVFDNPVPGGGGTTAPDKDGDKSASKPAKGRAELYRRGIRTIESGSPEGNYRARGAGRGKNDPALGAYQILLSNIGPWSKEVLGQAISAEQFLAAPNLQDAIFDAKFGEYVNK